MIDRATMWGMRRHPLADAGYRIERGLAIAIVLAAAALAATAQARVVRITRLADVCPGNDNWDKVAQCIRRHGTLTIERDQPDLKLVRVAAPSSFAGFYLYAHGAKWTHRGSLRVSEEGELLGLSRVRFGAHAGHRVDVGTVRTSAVTLDGVSSVGAQVRERESLVCFDDDWGCVVVTTACDVLVAGKAYYAFRGALVYEHHELRVVGDRAHIAPHCEQDELVLADQ